MQTQGQAPDLPPRKKTERSTTSCGECRRRKQKCNQGQPCSNCQRRFPEPICDYGPRRGDAPAFVAVLGPQIVRQHHKTTREPDAATSTVTPRRQVQRLSEPGLPGAAFWDAGHPGNGGGGGRGARPTSKAATRGQKAKNHTNTRGLAFGLDGIVYQCQLSGPVQSIGHLPIAPTKQNAMLLCTFPELLYRFKGSFDGEPDPDNPFITTYVPWCIQSPLLARTSLYISARSLAERGFVDQSSTMRTKGEAISALNEHLQSEMWISDEAMAGVVQFISIEWFFGEPEVVRAHLKGLREMVRLRGGFPSHGVGALVTKVALVDDFAIAWWLEDGPTMDKGRSDGFDFDYVEPAREHFKVRYGSPLARLGRGGSGGAPTFASCEDALGLHPATASILDDLRFLISLALALPTDPTPEQERKVKSTATWIYNRISRLNSESPGGPIASTEGADEDETTGNDDAAVESSGTRSKGSTLSPEAASDARPHSLLPDYPSYTSSSRVTTPSAGKEFGSPPVSGSGGERPNQSPTAGPDSEDREHPQEKQRSTASAPSELAPDGGQSGHEEKATDENKQEPDPLYTGVRLAAMLYARALAERRPFSEICLPSEALALLMATWRIPLGRWRGIIGVFLFMLMAIMPTIREIQHPGSRSRLVKAAAREKKGQQQQQQQASAPKTTPQTTRGAGDDATSTEGGGDGGGGGDEDDVTRRDDDDDVADAPRWDDPREVVSMAHVKPHSGFVKSIVQLGFMQMAIEDWGLCADTLRRGLALQRWLRGGDGRS
ncbi:hypothetical protein MAPG_04455 [Magnaporthiopsis poae ATCC 64411]|uniref:Zn(2)-C6 fungal-type domain-containing protein n=1 Tax=Magnaporthiopsis poae (strain ATCC 64411 / 73-15) TaxID=644358 RepID=A0A0C4DWS5_MAGP6|nr:hypothetical protein MAPG_04455 [Magnaporthiopsis poae ATCC 64411]